MLDFVGVLLELYEDQQYLLEMVQLKNRDFQSEKTQNFYLPAARRIIDESGLFIGY